MFVKRAARSTVCRCPACGHRLAQHPPARCPLCDVQFGDLRVTGVDVTPYALSYAHAARGFCGMSLWVWLAGWERLKHLALIRASAASKRFAWTNILLLALGLSMLQAARIGWRTVTNTPALEPTGSTLPSGRGWVHVTAAPRPLPATLAPETDVDLWWNPAQAIITAATGFVVAIVLIWLVLGLLRVGVTWAHKQPFRQEQRMTAAIHYSTAWGLPLFAGALIGSLGPWPQIGELSRWAWYPSARGLIVTASVLAGLGMTMWWFWLIRLGTTAPARTRGRVVTFFALPAPLILAAAIAASWGWLDAGRRHLFALLRLDF